jgi:hypothetical protein
LTERATPGTKFVPVTVIVPAGEPTRTLAGARVATVGTGLLTWTLFVVSAATTWVPLATDNLSTVPVCNCEAGTVARISVLLMNVVGAAVPESWITELDVNPVPVTTIVMADEPTGTSLGETEAMVSGPATGNVLPPEPGDKPGLAGAEPHPESRGAKRQKDTARRKPKGRDDQLYIENADYPSIASRAS